MTDTAAKIREALDDMLLLACEDEKQWETRRQEFERRITKASEALVLLDAERPSVPMEPLRLLYNMAALNGGIPNNRDAIITAHMAEFGFDVKETP
jgi:hypothetical protein